MYGASAEWASTRARHPQALGVADVIRMVVRDQNGVDVDEDRYEALAREALDLLATARHVRQRRQPVRSHHLGRVPGFLECVERQLARMRAGSPRVARSRPWDRGGSPNTRRAS